MSHIRKIWVLLLGFTTILLAQPDTVRVTTYNILNFPGNNYAERIGYLRTVIRNIRPDILALQEVESEFGVNYLSTHIFGSEYRHAAFHDGPDTGNALFYRSGNFTFVSADYLSTALRDIGHYILRHNISGENIHIFSAHLKASQGSTNEQKRLAEVTILRNYLNSLPANTNFIIVGDFNIYTASEPAFQHLTAGGLVRDPIHQSGDWHNNSQYKSIHTQSPRTDQFGGGSTGGLDDRFDLLLISDELTDNFLPGSYTAYGNDGNHFNLSINYGANSAVADSIADALHAASDHLPVFADFRFYNFSGLSRKTGRLPQKPQLYRNYPNPFNPETRIQFLLPRPAKAELSVYNVLGSKIATLVSGKLSGGTHSISWKAPASCPSGIYFIELKTGNLRAVQKTVLSR